MNLIDDFLDVFPRQAKASVEDFRVSIAGGGIRTPWSLLSYYVTTIRLWIRILILKLSWRIENYSNPRFLQPSSLCFNFSISKRKVLSYGNLCLILRANIHYSLFKHAPFDFKTWVLRCCICLVSLEIYFWLDWYWKRFGKLETSSFLLTGRS